MTSFNVVEGVQPEPIEEIIPLYDKVLIEVPQIEEKTAGGIIIPDEARERRQRVEMCVIVKAMGFNAFAQFPPRERPKIGDEVLVSKHAGSIGYVDGKPEYGTKIINDTDVLAIVRKSNE